MNKLNKKKSRRNEEVEPLRDWDLIKLRIRSPRVHTYYKEFKKTPSEKEQLRKARKLHNTMLLNAGISPSEQLNLSDPQIIRFAA